MTTETQNLQSELATFNAKRAADKAENTAECGAPKIKRTFTYRKQTIIKSSIWG